MLIIINPRQMEKPIDQIDDLIKIQLKEKKNLSPCFKKMKMKIRKKMAK